MQPLPDLAPVPATVPATVPVPVPGTLRPNDDSLYRMLVQNVTDFAIYLLSPDGIVTNWNAGAQRAKGYLPEEIVGQHFSRFYLEEDRAADLPDRALAIARRDGKFEDEGWRLRKDGSRLRAHVVIDPVYDETDTLIGFAKITRDITAQYEARRAADEQTRNFRLLAQGVTDHSIYMLDTQGRVSNWNAGAERTKGYAAQDIVGRHFSIFYTADDRQAGLPYRALATALARGKFENEGWRVRRDGSRFWALVTIDPIHDEHHRHIGFANITHDLTSHKNQLDQIKAMRDNLDLALAHMSQGLCLFDSHECLVVRNSRFTELLALDGAALPPGSTYTDLLWLMHARSSASAEQIAARVSEARARHLTASTVPAHQQEYTLNGRIITISDRFLPDGGWVSTIDDVTERREMEREVVHLAHHDVLTDLPNRAAFQTRLTETLTNPGRTTSCALIYIDLDRFKQINDSFGHPMGDEVLRITAGRIRENVRPRDTVARLGGDEFVILCQDVYEDRDAESLAERLARDLSRPLDLPCGTIATSASIGVAMAGPDDTDAEALIHHADLAMYAAKDAGRGRALRYEPGMREALQKRRALEHDLRESLENDGFALVYQPVVDTKTGRITSFETLLRWHHPVRGNIPPIDFIPFAEEIGLMPRIDDWVMRTACRQATYWREDIGVSVNLSPTRLRLPGLVDAVRVTLADCGLAPERLEIEITETSMIADLDNARTVLGELRALGVKIAMDDFGTGYSSLSFLREIPFTRIKIDRSFINDLGESAEATAIVRAIAGICNSLDVHVTAEGVETDNQANLLRREGCFEHQGYLISRPCPPQDIDEWIRAFDAAPAAVDTRNVTRLVS